MKISTRTKEKLLLLTLMLFAVTSLQAQTAFPSCTAEVSYVTRNASGTASTLPYTLYSVNLATGAQTSLGTVKVGGYNVRVEGIGYNSADNFIYGSEAGTKNILKIGSDGTATRIPISNWGAYDPALNSLLFQAGDVAGGYLYLYRALDGNSRWIYKVNLATNTAETFQLPSGAGVAMTDFSVGSDGKIYGISDAGNYIVFTLTSATAPATLGTATRTVTDLGLPGPTGYNSFMGSDGLLYAQSISGTGATSTGNTYVIDPATGKVKLILVNGAVTGQNNSDGATCKTVTPYQVDQPGFGCQSGWGYLWDQDSQLLYSVNTNGTPVESLMKDYSIPGSYNNLGFNPKDGSLYLHRQNTDQLMRIREDLSVEYITIPGLPQVWLNSGEFDEDGIFYMMNGQNNTKTTYKVDLNPSSPTYKTLLNPLGFTWSPNVTDDIVDMAVNPVDGMLYGIGSTNNNLYRINPNSGATCNLGDVGISTAKVAVFSDPTGYLYFRTSGGTTLYRVKIPVQNIPCGNTSTALSGSVSVLTGLGFTGNGDGARCLLSPFEGVVIGGSIWNDGNGNHIVDGSENTTTATLPAGETLTVYLVNPENVVVGKADVDANGNWSMPDVAPGSYTVKLSNDSSKGLTESAVGLSTELPADWNNTGYNFGPTFGNGTGASGPVTVANADISGLDFGINKKPVVTDGTEDPQTNPGGSGPANTVPVGADLFNGTDLEDNATPNGPYPNNLTGREVTLSSGTNGDVYYDGVIVPTGGMTIPNFDPTKVTVDPEGTSIVQTPTVIFTYTVKDNAGIISDPKTIRVPIIADPMPVTLTSFTAKKGEGISVNLDWATTEETNSEKFEIQHSTNGKNWNVIENIAAKGESKELSRYNYTHTTPANGENLYRLRMVDFDKTFAYSKIVGVNMEMANTDRAFVFPNPSDNVLHLGNVDLEKINKVEVSDTNGKVVYSTGKVPADGINTNRFAAGAYVMSITFKDGTVQNSKVVIVK